MKKILVLEDFEGRVTELKTLLPLDSICWCTTVEHFIQVYTSEDWDLVILDHDLDLTDHRTGQQAVDFMRQQEQRHTVLIWSINPAGGIFMRQRLLQKGFKVIHSPFPGILRQPASLAWLLNDNS